MKFIETAKKMLPGCAIALVIAVAAKLLEQLEESAGLHLIGASVIAMFIGMIVNALLQAEQRDSAGNQIYIEEDPEICDHSARCEPEYHARC